MPVSVYTVSVRGWGKTPEEADINAKRRAQAWNDSVQANERINDPGIDERHSDPGDGGPCEPERVIFEFLIAAQDLPEFKRRDDD